VTDTASQIPVLPVTARAWELRGGALEPTERDVPRPRSDQVLVQVRAVSLNRRDILVAENFYGPVDGLIPVSDGVGVVAGVGSDVDPARVGERVAGAFFPDWIGGEITARRRARSPGASVDGMLAEYAILDAQAALAVPEHLTNAEAATLPCAGLTAWNALSAARVGPGKTVLLQGAGGVSVMALQFAKALGARVIHTSSSAEKRARLLALGADHVIDYVAEPDWHRMVLDLTDGQGADLIVEVGGPGTLDRSTRCVRFGGTIACVGFVSEGPGLDPKLIIGRSIRLIGITVGSCDQFAEMAAAISAAHLRPVIDCVLPFEKAPDAYERLRTGGHFGKIVIAGKHGTGDNKAEPGADGTPTSTGAAGRTV